MIRPTQQTVVVVGNGMVGHRFCERLIELDSARQFRIVTFCEEPRAAYDRVGLTSFFAHRDPAQLMLAQSDWYREQQIDLHIGDRATQIDRSARIVTSAQGRQIGFDKLVLATGSYPFVPPTPGIQKQGVFLYRTLADLENILAYAPRAQRCAVIGGGLLGLEAAKAAFDLGLQTDVIEFAPKLMPRQLDEAGSRTLISKIESLGVRVHLNQSVKQVLGDECVEGLLLNDGQTLPVQMVIVSAGIRPRDELARACELSVGERGGVLVNDRLETSDPDIFAIGEVACHKGMVYGLVAPGYEMAAIAAQNLVGGERLFSGADLSTKLKLMGVDVASFGDYEAPADRVVPIIFTDPFRGVYRKLLFDRQGETLVGGVLVGDASDYGDLLGLARSRAKLPCSPADLVVPPSTLEARAPGAAQGVAKGLPDETQICSCNQVTQGQIRTAIGAGASTLGQLKACTRAGTGCGGCIPQVTRLLNTELAAIGKGTSPRLCEHFSHTRQELFEIIKIKQLKTFDAVLESHGSGAGCEICKPTVASILASLWNEHVLAPSHQTIQDTNDRFLANIQRGGLYSVVPRVPGGEITPDQLIALGTIAKKYNLYTKITGGQRVDLFGAQVHQLPEIWEAIISAGMESGHAYGKAMRTVKSCVGSTWCRYGVQDSVGFAIRIEKRYRGLRAPHKLKAAVSGCIRECAEAQCKDFGLIATEKGYNLYVCGNGGSRPRHADLFATDLDEETATRYIDRFLMYYIHTADRLMRTSVWLENLAGGIEHLRAVVIDDKLGLCDQFEREMQELVDTYRCEWTEVVNDPEKRAAFRQFVNTDETELGIDIVDERGQNRPADWSRTDSYVASDPLIQLTVPSSEFTSFNTSGGNHIVPNDSAQPMRTRRATKPEPQPRWVDVGTEGDFPVDGGAAVKVGRVQIAVFRFAAKGTWYATQNMCPHKRSFVLSSGILGTASDVPKVACPLHKRTFSLLSGECLSGETETIKTFPVRVVDQRVEVLLPPQEQLDALLATERHCVSDCRQTALVLA